MTNLDPFATGPFIFDKWRGLWLRALVFLVFVAPIMFVLGYLFLQFVSGPIAVAEIAWLGVAPMFGFFLFGIYDQGKTAITAARTRTIVDREGITKEWRGGRKIYIQWSELAKISPTFFFNEGRLESKNKRINLNLDIVGHDYLYDAAIVFQQMNREGNIRTNTYSDLEKRMQAEALRFEGPKRLTAPLVLAPLFFFSLSVSVSVMLLTSYPGDETIVTAWIV